MLDDMSLWTLRVRPERSVVANEHGYYDLTVTSGTLRVVAAVTTLGGRTLYETRRNVTATMGAGQGRWWFSLAGRVSNAVFVAEGSDFPYNCGRVWDEIEAKDGPNGDLLILAGSAKHPHIARGCPPLQFVLSEAVAPFMVSSVHLAGFVEEAEVREWTFTLATNKTVAMTPSREVGGTLLHGRLDFSQNGELLTPKRLAGLMESEAARILASSHFVAGVFPSVPYQLGDATCWSVDAYRWCETHAPAFFKVTASSDIAPRGAPPDNFIEACWVLWEGVVGVAAAARFYESPFRLPNRVLARAATAVVIIGLFPHIVIRFMDIPDTQAGIHNAAKLVMCIGKQYPLHRVKFDDTVVNREAVVDALFISRLLHEKTAKFFIPGPLAPSVFDLNEFRFPQPRSSARTLGPAPIPPSPPTSLRDSNLGGHARRKPPLWRTGGTHARRNPARRRKPRCGCD